MTVIVTIVGLDIFLSFFFFNILWIRAERFPVWTIRVYVVSNCVRKHVEDVILGIIIGLTNVL